MLYKELYWPNSQTTLDVVQNETDMLMAYVWKKTFTKIYSKTDFKLLLGRS